MSRKKNKKPDNNTTYQEDDWLVRDFSMKDSDTAREWAGQLLMDLSPAMDTALRQEILINGMDIKDDPLDMLFSAADI
jgi:hypothetical protein